MTLQDAARLTNFDWEEDKHPRKGGKFAPKGGGGDETPSEKQDEPEPKTHSIVGIGSVTQHADKTVLKVSWLGKAALETAAGAAAVAALPEVAVGAAGVVFGGLLEKVVGKIATTVGSKAIGALAAKLGATAAERATATAAGQAIAGVAESHAKGAGALGFLANRLSRVHVETEAGWFKPSTITIDKKG